MITLANFGLELLVKFLIRGPNEPLLADESLILGVAKSRVTTINATWKPRDLLCFKEVARSVIGCSDLPEHGNDDSQSLMKSLAYQSILRSFLRAVSSTSFFSGVLNLTFSTGTIECVEVRTTIDVGDVFVEVPSNETKYRPC